MSEYPVYQRVKDFEAGKSLAAEESRGRQEGMKACRRIVRLLRARGGTAYGGSDHHDSGDIRERRFWFASPTGSGVCLQWHNGGAVSTMFVQAPSVPDFIEGLKSLQAKPTWTRVCQVQDRAFAAWCVRVVRKYSGRARSIAHDLRVDVKYSEADALFVNCYQSTVQRAIGVLFEFGVLGG